MRDGYDEIINMRLLHHGLLHYEDTVGLSQLLGIQAQFFSYAQYSAKIRQINIETSDVFKAWTLRGTMHIHDIRDYAVFVHDDLMSKYMKEFWEDESIIPKKRKSFFCDRMLACINEGVAGKNDIIAQCFEAGMTDVEKAFLFNSWGGIPRFLVESGEIVLRASKDTKYAIAPHVEKMSGVQAEAEQLRRYINTYGPVTIYDMMYFFKWSKSKCTRYLGEIEHREITWLGEEFYDIDKDYRDLNQENDVLVFSGFDPFIIGYEKKNSLIIQPQNIRDIYLLQGVIRPTLFWKEHVVGVWWKTNNTVNIKFFEELPGEVKTKIFESLFRILEDEQISFNEIAMTASQ